MVWLWNNLEIMFANHLSDTKYDNSLQNILPPPWQNQNHLTNRCKKQQQCKQQQQPCNFMMQNSCSRITQTTIVQIHGNSHQLIRIHCLDETLVWLFGKSSERISANAQLARKRNSYANFVQNQSTNREWIRTTKTAWSESTETDTANQTLLVPTNMYIIQLHTWECVLLNKLVQTRISKKGYRILWSVYQT